MHQSCIVTLSSSVKLSQAKTRKEKKERSDTVTPTSDKDVLVEQCQYGPNDHKKLRSSTGLLHQKHLCVWCMKPKDTKHPGRSKGGWNLMSTDIAWQQFKRHTVLLEDPDIRDRLVKLIDTITDPFGTEMRCHYYCWMQNITNKHEILISPAMAYLAFYILFWEN